MVGEVKIADLPRCLAKMKQMNASEKQIWNISSSISSIQNFAVNASAHAEFKEVSGVEIISENERRAQFTYALIMDPPISKDFKPLTADDLKFPDACLENSPVLRLLVGSGGTKPIVIPAIATFKRFSDGWRVVDFSSEFTGPVEKRPPFLLILEEQLAIK